LYGCSIRFNQQEHNASIQYRTIAALFPRISLKGAAPVAHALYTRRMRTSLGPLLQSIALSTLASVTGCGSGTTAAGDAGTPTLNEVGTLQICSGGMLPDRYQGLTLAADVDGMVVREPVSFGPTDAGNVSDKLLATLGETCKVPAAEKSSCELVLAQLVVSGGWNPDGPSAGNAVPARVYAIKTAPTNKVIAVETFPEFVKALAPIETLPEAVLVAMQSGHRFNCSKNNARPAPGGGYELITQTGGVCANLVENLVRVAPDGSIVVLKSVVVQTYSGPCSVGRRPEGLKVKPSLWSASMGATFAEIAHLEAASIHTFADLGRKLAVLNAPVGLLERVEAARKDEVRHARVMTRLANKFGGDVAAPVIHGRESRSLFELARENVVEGCVRETYGALVAHYQAGAARDSEIAGVMRSIAHDETAHAELSWDLAAWYDAQLTEQEREAIATAKQQAFTELAEQLSVEPASEVVAQAGLPAAATAKALLASLRSSLEVN
jgi:hypothetical protein